MRRHGLPCSPLLSACLLLTAGIAHANVLLDQDGDGAADFASVGDWDGDGLRELTDVQAAVDALTDPGPKWIFVEAGSYLPPAVPPRNHGLVELPSNSHLECAGTTATILRGVPASVTNLNRSVLTNQDHFGGNQNIQITNCQIDGAMPNAYDSRGWTATGRMGINLNRVSGATVTGNFVHHTHHSCLYTKNSEDILFENNVLENCGAYGDFSTLRKPAIYLFATAGGVTQRVTAAGNVIRRSGGSGLNTRRDNVIDTIMDVEFRDNFVDNTSAPYALRAPEKCVTIRGTEGIRLLRNECIHTSSVHVAASPTGYSGEATEHADSSRDVLIEDLVMSDVETYRGIVIGERVDGLVLRRVEIRRTPANQPCLSWVTPLRGLLLEDVYVSDCGGQGILQTGPGSGASVAERIQLRRVTVEGADAVATADLSFWHGIEIQGTNDGLSLVDVTVRGASGHGLRVGFSAGPLSNSTLSGIRVDGTPSGFLGRSTAAGLPACDAGREGAWAVVVDAPSASTCSGTGGTENSCRCVAGAWTDLTNAAGASRYGIEIPGGESRGNSFLDLHLDDVHDSFGLRLFGAQQDSVVSLVRAMDRGEIATQRQRGAVVADASATHVTVTGALCLGTVPGLLCVSGLADSDGDAVPDASDNCLYTINANQADADGNGIGDACEGSNQDCGLGPEIVLLLFGLAQLRRRRSRGRSSAGGGSTKLAFRQLDV